MYSQAFSGRSALRVAAVAAAATIGIYAVFTFFGDSAPGESASLISPPAQAAKTTGAVAVGAVTGLPLPRFVSLKSSEVNVRRGAGTEHDVVWSYHRSGLPVEIIAEWDNWRRIRDADGADGWVFHRLLQSKRTALVAPWSSDPIVALRRTAEADGRVVAQLQPNVMTNVAACDGTWCRVTGDGFEGYIEQEKLFGVYPGEQFN